MIAFLRATTTPPFFPGNRAKAELRSLTVPFRFGAQRRYRAMRPGVGKVPAAPLEPESSYHE